MHEDSCARLGTAPAVRFGACVGSHHHLNPRQHRTVEERRGTLLHRNTLEMSYDAGVAVKHAIDHLVIIDHLVSLQHAQGQI